MAGSNEQNHAQRQQHLHPGGLARHSRRAKSRSQRLDREEARMIPTITINTAPAPEPECICTHPHGDAITCIAEQNGMSRFNAMLTFAHGDIERYPGQCPCPCHRAEYRSAVTVQREGAKKARRAK